MSARPSTRRVFPLLVAGSLIAVVACASFVQMALAGHGAPPLCSEKEGEGGSDTLNDVLKFESFELNAVLTVPGEVPSHAYTERLADETADAESAFNAAHLQRGPPVC